MAKKATKRNAHIVKASSRKKRRPIHVSHRRHTGKRLAFHETSYALLFFLIIFSALSVFIIRHVIVSGQTVTDSGSVTLSGVVPGAPPSIPATIGSPTDNSTVTNALVTVTGTCEHDYIVEVYRNGTLAGSITCDTNGEYVIEISLVPGSNSILVRTTDIFNQYGPDSATITLFYDTTIKLTPEPESNPATPSNNPTPTINTSKVIVKSKGYFRVSQETKTVLLKFRIREGQAPYRVTVDWGDGQSSEATFSKSGDQTMKHTYETSGQYEVKITVLDASGSSAFFQTVVVVDGKTSVNLSATGNLTQRCQLDAVCIFQNQIVDGANRAWPAFALVTIMTFSFWIGEKIAISLIVKRVVR
ncbi:hypothetical protein KA047_00670 [Candidatus Saccharibacteria bacterium]|nr:hypothetical protein [Candidatus Saccharibacteria bacterium]